MKYDKSPIVTVRFNLNVNHLKEEKTCSTCREIKPLLEFNKKRNGLSYSCKKCLSLYYKTHYSKNKSSYINRSAEYTKKIKEKIDQRKDNPCVDCGVKYSPWVMDFDHVHGDKLFTISSMKNKGSLKKVLEEIDKCELVCANCHRERTHKRRVNKMVS